MRCVLPVCGQTEFCRGAVVGVTLTSVEPPHRVFCGTSIPRIQSDAVLQNVLAVPSRCLSSLPPPTPLFSYRWCSSRVVLALASWSRRLIGTCRCTTECGVQTRGVSMFYRLPGRARWTSGCRNQTALQTSAIFCSPCAQSHQLHTSRTRSTATSGDAIGIPRAPRSAARSEVRGCWAGCGI